MQGEEVESNGGITGKGGRSLRAPEPLQGKHG